MASRRRSSPGNGKGIVFTVLAYTSAVLVAMALCGVIGPGGLWHPSGVKREYRSYQVLELPVSREELGSGPLAAEGREIPPPHQKLMERRGLSLAEYTVWLRNYSWEGLRRRVSQGGVRYQIYFVPAELGVTRIPIPVGYRYSLSGDGEEGFIVTIWAR